MSRPAKTSGGASAPASDLPFEAAMQKLESIVEAMESDELPLEALLARYEEGVQLVDVCQAKLAAAEVKIAQLEQTAAGETVLKSLPPPESSGAE